MYFTKLLISYKEKRQVEPNIHRGRERLMHQVTKLNRDNRGACACQMNPNKTSEHNMQMK